MSFLVFRKKKKNNLIKVSVLRRYWKKEKIRFKKKSKKKLKLRKYLLVRYLTKYPSLYLLVLKKKYLRYFRKVIKNEKVLSNINIKLLKNKSEFYKINYYKLERRKLFKMIIEILLMKQVSLTNYLLYRLSVILKRKYFFLEKRVYNKKIYKKVFGIITFRKTLNNIFVTLEKKKDKKLVKLSGGMSFMKSKGKKYLKFPFGVTLGSYLGWRYHNKIFIIKLKGRVRPILKGFFTTFFKAGCKVSYIYLIPMISYNGCRLKKKRRL